MTEVKIGRANQYLKYFVSFLLHPPCPQHMTVLRVLLLQSLNHILQLDHLLAYECLQEEEEEERKL